MIIRIKLQKILLSNLDNKLDGIILVSAHGAGESLKDSNIGIKIMNNLYLRDIYRAKNSQEKIYSIKSRQTLAREILEYLYINTNNINHQLYYLY